MGLSTIRIIIQQGPDSLKTSSSGIRPKTDIFPNYVSRNDLQRLIGNYHSQKKCSTLNTLLTNARDSLEFKGGRTSLFKILKSMGYKYEFGNGRKTLCEQKHVVASKITFLRRFIQFQNSSENITFVYLDETWIYQNGSQVRKWVHESDIKLNPSKIQPEGKRFTILDAGCNLGFLEGCDLLLD